MERYLEQREKIGRKLARLQKRLDKAYVTFNSNLNDQLNEVEKQQQLVKIDDLKEQIDIMKSNIEYIQEQISECQANIIELDDSKVK